MKLDIRIITKYEDLELEKFSRVWRLLNNDFINPIKYDSKEPVKRTYNESAFEDAFNLLLDYEMLIVYGKKKGSGAITLQKTKTAIVIGHTKEGYPQGDVNKGVAIIADYLESLGM